MRTIIAAVAVMLALGGPSRAHCVPPASHSSIPTFLDGSFLAGLPDPHLESYVLGVVDGLDFAGCDTPSLLPPGVKSNQLRAMFRKWLTDNPDQWHTAGSTLVWNMIVTHYKSR